MPNMKKCTQHENITYLDLIQSDGCPQYVVRCKDCNKLGIIYLVEGNNDWDAFTNSKHKPKHKRKTRNK